MADGDADKQPGNVPVIRIDDGDWAELDAILGGDISDVDAILGEGSASADAQKPEPEPAPAPEKKPVSVDDLLEQTLNEANSALAAQSEGRTASVAAQAPIQDEVPVTQEEPVRRAPEPDGGPPIIEPGQSSVMQRLVDRERQMIEEKNRDSQAVSQLRDKVKKFADETESFKKRIKEEAVGARALGHEDIIVPLVAALDTLELAMQSKGDINQIVMGLEMVIKQLLADLNHHGLRKINPLNQTFDPSLHEAVVSEPNGDVAPNTVIQVRRPGYVLREKLIRPAQVVVASEPE